MSQRNVTHWDNPTFSLALILIDPCIVDYSVAIPTRCSFGIEFIIPKFFKGSTCFERHAAYHQELQAVFAASGLYAHMVTGRCQGWVGTAHSALATAGHPMGMWARGCKYSLELLMISGVPLETCWAFKELWNNKFYYKAAYCWYFYWVSLICNVQY